MDYGKGYKNITIYVVLSAQQQEKLQDEVIQKHTELVQRMHVYKKPKCFK
jgi:hypothetical protein